MYENTVTDLIKWKPELDRNNYYCIVCERAFTSIIQLKLPKKDTPCYTIDFCSDKCMKEWSSKAHIRVKDFRYHKEHLDSGYWYNRWVKIYNARRNGEDIVKYVEKMDKTEKLRDKISIWEKYDLQQYKKTNQGR